MKAKCKGDRPAWKCGKILDAKAHPNEKLAHLVIVECPVHGPRSIERKNVLKEKAVATKRRPAPAKPKPAAPKPEDDDVKLDEEPTVVEDDGKESGEEE